MEEKLKKNEELKSTSLLKGQSGSQSEKYSVEDFEKAANTVFGVPSECVKAAFFVAGKKKATETEAKKLVSDFMKKEVR